MRRHVQATPEGLRRGGSSGRGRDKIRKLPSYEELKRLVVDEGMTYPEVAEKFGCTRRAVSMALKARAQRRGEWPLPMDRSAKVSRTIQAWHDEQKAEITPQLLARLELRLAFNHESPQAFAYRHGFNPSTLRAVLNGDRPMMRQNWVDRLVEAIRADARNDPLHS